MEISGLSIITVILAVLIQPSLVSTGSSCTPVCNLGYQFCEPVKSICRNCADFEDFCFHDNQHISNCSTYCKGIYGIFNNSRPQTQCKTDDALRISVIVLSILLFGTIISFVLYRYVTRRQSNFDTGSANSNFSSVTTVSSKDKTCEDVDSTVLLLDENQDLSDKEYNNLKQIGTTNDRQDEPKLMVSGQMLDKKALPFETSRKSMD